MHFIEIKHSILRTRIPLTFSVNGSISSVFPVEPRKEKTHKFKFVDEIQLKRTIVSTANGVYSQQAMITSRNIHKRVKQTNCICWIDTRIALHRITSPGLTWFGLEPRLSTESRLIVSGQRVRDSMNTLVLATFNLTSDREENSDTLHFS